MVLCFGTYANVLKWASRFGGDKALVSSVVGTIDPGNRYGDKYADTPVSRLMNCHKGFPNVQVDAGSGIYRETEGSVTHVVQLAGGMSTAEVASKFDSVIEQIHEDKKKAAVAALQYIVKEDPSLEGAHKATFEKCMGATAAEVVAWDKVNLSLFLAGLFLYTVLTNENEDGKGTLVEIKKKGYLDRFLDAEIEWLEENDDVPAIAEPDAIASYLEALKRKYNRIKTLLYYDEPHPFYDFYICNLIIKRTQKSVDDGYNFQRIEDATPALLAEHDPYVIIEAYGGMGKSMMMRHFLLKGIEEYDSTHKLPIFIQLKDYPGGSTYTDLLNHIYSSTVHLLSSITLAQFKEVLAAGDCLLLLDGLDELTSTYQEDFEKALDQFMDMFPACQYIMSSRPFTDFVSFDRFTTMHLSSFSDEQSLQLIEKLEYREDDKSIKQKFVDALKSDLFESHHDFTSNPLLLTIMLMTFGQVAEISKTMHIFYRDAYSVLAQKHDASKGAFKRKLKTGLSSDQFADYFAEFCARSYTGEKYKMTGEEAVGYFNGLNERKKHPEFTASASDFLYDLCANMCLMYQESGMYHFTHRSFQEYFCALYFSKQKDKQLEKIGKFFENSRIHFFATSTFSMLYEMIPEKVEEYIFMPFLDELLKECEEKDGYWTYLEKMYPRIFYAVENGSTVMDAMDAKSFITDFILGILEQDWHSAYSLPVPLYEEFISSKYVHLEGEEDIVEVSEIPEGYVEEHGMPEIDSYGYSFQTAMIRENPDKFKDMIAFLSRTDFPPQEEYEKLKKYKDHLHKLYDGFDVKSEDLFDSF